MNNKGVKILKTDIMKGEKIPVLQNVFNGAAEREDVHILPDEIGWVWESSEMVISRDGSSAASNGAKETWINNDVIDHVCAWHGSNRWFQQHISLLKKKII